MVYSFPPGHPPVGLNPGEDAGWHWARPLPASRMAACPRRSGPHPTQRSGDAIGGGPQGSSRPSRDRRSRAGGRLSPPARPTARHIAGARPARRPSPVDRLASARARDRGSVGHVAGRAGLRAPGSPRSPGPCPAPKLVESGGCSLQTSGTLAPPKTGSVCPLWGRQAGAYDRAPCRPPPGPLPPALAEGSDTAR